MITTENSLLLVIDIQTKLFTAMPNCEQLVKSAETLVKGCRLLDIPILVSQQYTKGLGDTIPSLKAVLGEFEPIEKNTFSCCGNSEFVSALEKAGRQNIIISGIEAHICVQQTVLDLLVAGYGVYVIADCIFSRKETDRIYAEKRMRNAGAILTTTESVLFELLKSADHPKRKEISNLIK